MNKMMVAVCVVALVSVGCDGGSSTSEDSEPPAESQAGEAAEADEETGDASDVEVVPLQHGSFLVEWGEATIAVDPVGEALEATDEEVSGVDLVLLTDIHPDHLDPEAVDEVGGEDAEVVAPQAVVDEAGDALPDPTIMGNGDTETLLDGELSIEATPMYNIERTNPETGEPFHPEGRGNGYLLERDGTRVYISGDTECTPEMRELEDIDLALVTMNVPYTMPVEEAAGCIREFRPSVVIPFHYRGEDPAQLKESLADVEDVEVRLLEWYPGEE